jgi:hypothetical protein
MSMNQIVCLRDYFGYDVVIDGDNATADIYCGDALLYSVTLA